MNSIKKRLLDLYKLLRYHDYLYHSVDMPIISNEEYDYLLKKFYSLKKKHNDLFDEISNCNFQLIKNYKYHSDYHFTPMLSLDNTFDINGYIKFHNNIKNNFKNYNVQFCCELKFDGIALSLLYKNGKLIRALTRGDGFLGENVINNISLIKNIPLILLGKVPEVLEVRGEVCMLKRDFQKLNIFSKNNNHKIFSNARNIVAGSLRHKNIEVIKNRKLFFFAYGCNIISNFSEYYTHIEQLYMLYNFGFSISHYLLISSNINQIISFYYLMQKIRNFLSLNIDGIVVKVNSLTLQNNLGYTSKFPKWALAIKFISQFENTTLLSVTYQVGRTGIVTPVANLEPVLLSGAIIQKSSLYNKNEMDKLNLFFHDTVIVHRVGDVVPKIHSVIINNRLHCAKKISFPKYCPSCNSLLSSNKSNTVIQCLGGFNCFDQRVKYIEHFFSKNALYAEGFSTGIIKKLAKQGYIHTPLDCFKLTLKTLSQLKYFGKKSAFKIINSLKRCKNTTLSRFIYALGISEIGVENANLISEHFGSLDKILSCSIHELQKIKCIGNICASYFFDFFNSKKNVQYVMQLIHEGEIKFIDFFSSLVQDKESFFKNKKIVLTGRFKRCARKEMIKLISSSGGIVMDNISKKVDLLIIGEKPGSKVMHASYLNIKIILEDDMIKFFDHGNNLRKI